MPPSGSAAQAALLPGGFAPGGGPGASGGIAGGRGAVATATVSPLRVCNTWRIIISCEEKR